MGSRRFRFSVIIPVYNVENYIEEAIQSIISQDIGFADNVQIILVNDGSSDGSGKVCSRYAALYPDNIIFIDKENGGVSSARNEGLRHVQGEYVNFLDSDDTWQQGSFLAVDRFIREHPDIRVFFTGLRFTGRKEGKKYHLDYQYETTQILDITENYDYPQIRVATAFISSDLLTEEFDTEITIGEDMLYINRILLDEKKYAIVSDAVYLYRKRGEENSAIDTKEETVPFYKVTPYKVFRALADLSFQKFGSVIPYIQYLLITDIRWRLRKRPSDILSADDKAEYLRIMHELMDLIDNEIIMSHRNMARREKVYALIFKNGEEAYRANEEVHRRFVKKPVLSVIILEANGSELYLSGVAKEKYFGENYYIYAGDQDGNIYNAEYERYPLQDFRGIDSGIVLPGYRYSFRLPVRPGMVYHFYVAGGVREPREMNVEYGQFSRLTDRRGSFFLANGCRVHSYHKKIEVHANDPESESKAVKKYLDDLRERAGDEAAGIWQEAFELKKDSSKKPIWIISDRTHVAGDNGEALFRYLMKKGEFLRHDIYFLLEESSSDYAMMKRVSLGRVLKYGSREHIVKHLAAQMIISSQADMWVTAPYGRDCDYYRNLAEFQFVFLQHGIIKDDLSSWLHLLRKNIKMFITSAEPEYQSVVRGNYGYDESVVKLTGLARYDKLKDGRKKIIAILPTWRKYLANEEQQGSGRGYFEKFRDSDFCRFYNRLINDDRLITALKKQGYRGYFYLHPAHAEQAQDFSGNNVIKVWSDNIDYPKVFAESALLVTDYSSVAMDFAYLGKPVIYTQFDRDQFFAGHTYDPGYFSYSEDGFGPLVTSYEDTVAAIISAVQGRCRQPDEYRKRVDRFFAFTDRHNCRRIYDELKKLEETL